MLDWLTALITLVVLFLPTLAAMTLVAARSPQLGLLWLALVIFLPLIGPLLALTALRHRRDPQRRAAS